MFDLVEVVMFGRLQGDPAEIFISEPEVTLSTSDE
jgi:hypothetical protein